MSEREIRAALLGAYLAQGLEPEAALARARADWGWVERGEAMLALPAPAARQQSAQTAAAKPAAVAAAKPAAAGTAPARAQGGAGGGATRRRWSEADRDELRRRWALGESAPQIARALGRKVQHVYSFAYDLGLPRRKGRAAGEARAAAETKPEPMTQSLPPAAAGQGPTGRAPASIATVIAFLRRRDYTVKTRADGLYDLDGRCVTRDGLVTIANRQARSIGRAEFTVAA